MTTRKRAVRKRKRTTHVMRCGPYRVTSCANGTLVVTPAWPQYTSRVGGLFSRMALAEDVQRMLNREIKGANRTLAALAALA